MRKVLIVLPALCAVLLSGCDWIRARLDMPTSEDINRKRELIAQKEAAQKAAADKAASDTLSATDTVSVAGNLPQPEVQPAENAKDKTDAPGQNASPATSTSGFSITPKSSLDKTYYIIVGVFKTDALVAASIKEHGGILGEPMVFMANGLKHVSIGGYDTLEEARAAIAKVTSKAPDAWLYKKK